MTLSLCWNNHDGAVLGCDSTATLVVGQLGSSSPPTRKHYNSAQKLFQLGPPTENTFIPGQSFSGGAMVAGDGSFGQMSWRTFLNRLYVRQIEPSLAKGSLSVESVAEAILEHARQCWVTGVQTEDSLPDAVLCVAFVHQEGVGAVRVGLRTGDKAPLAPGAVVAHGKLEPLKRLSTTIGESAWAELIKLGVEEEKLRAARDAAGRNWGQMAFHPFVPLRDMVDLVHFSIYLTSKFYRYALDKPHGEPVGGSVEIATVTEDRGFRWVMHKPFTESVGIPHGGTL